MLTRRSARLPLSVLLVVGFLLSTGPVAYSQANRPRSSGQSTEPSWAVPENTVINARMTGRLSSKTSRAGDRFTATVTEPAVVGGRTLIPEGTVIEGRVVQVTPARRMGRAGSIAIDFDELVFADGRRTRLVGSLTSPDSGVRGSVDNEGRVSGAEENRSAVFIGGGGIIGAVLGSIAGGGKGAMIGGVAGAGAGLAAVLLTKGDDAIVRAGTRFGVLLRQPVIIIDDHVAGLGYSPDPEPSQPVYTPPPDPDPDPVATPSSEPPPTVEIQPESPEVSEAILPLSSSEMILRAQTALRDRGYYEGPLDGESSPRLARSLRAYQSENNLPETGELDTATAESLGIVRRSAPVRQQVPAQRGTGEPVLADVVSAQATRQSNGGIRVIIETRANTGGWRWYGESFVNGDTLQVFARAIGPGGPAAQVITRGRIELDVGEGVQYVTRVVVRGVRGDLSIPLGGTPDQSAGVGIQRQAEELLAEFQRVTGLRMTGASIEVEGGGQPADEDVELLFALDGFISAAQLHNRLARSVSDPKTLRTAVLSLGREARKTDRILMTTSSRAGSALEGRWDRIRQDVLGLMAVHGVSTSELEY